MIPELAFQALGAHVLRVGDAAERLALLEALAAVGAAAHLSSLAADAVRLADAMRAADTLQLTFLERLSTQTQPPGKDGSRPQ